MRLSFSPRCTSITIEGILVQQNSVGCIKMKGAVRVSLTESERERERKGEREAKRENKHTGIVELWVKTAEANQVWFPRCSGGLIEKQKVYDSVLLSKRLSGCRLSLPRNSAKTHAVKYKGEHLQKHKTPGFNMVTKMFHVSSLLMPKREEVGVGVRERGREERTRGGICPHICYQFRALKISTRFHWSRVEHQECFSI